MDGSPLPVGTELAEFLCKKALIEYSQENLNTVYNAVKEIQGELNLQSYLEEKFKHCRYSDDYKKLANLPFKRIYTLNIDDCLQGAFFAQRKHLNIKNRNDATDEYSFENDITTLVKLNGDINNPTLGFIFSPEEYAKNTISNNNWYKELAQDMHTYTFVFIGTKLNEPLLDYHIQKFKNDNKISSSVRGFVITPKASEIEKLSLKNSNLEHISGTLKDFVNYFYDYFKDDIPTHKDILRNIKPYVINSDYDLEIVSKIVPITKTNIIDPNINNSKSTVIESFYKGFKPSWKDIVNNIPALLKKTEVFINANLENFDKSNKLYVIVGNAGSGKSTALKQIAINLLNKTTTPIFFIDNSYNSLKDIIKYLDSIIKSNYIICIDRIINNRYSEISEILSNKSKASFIITENTTLWEKKAKSILAEYCSNYLDISYIEKEDVTKILENLKQYGSWTRLEKMSPQKRHSELWSKSKKQLLVGLLETTTGLGYEEIIQRDFDSITSSTEKNLLLLASIPALENLTANQKTLAKALNFLDENFNQGVEELAKNMQGILLYKEGTVSTRHRVYSDRLFKNLNNSKNFEIIEAYIMAFCSYQFPVVRHISKKEAEIYKQLVNLKFLKKYFNNDKEFVLKIYENFEKYLEHDGLFLAQYGLALRQYQRHLEAYEKLLLAKSAYPESPHIEHSLAQQMLILASTFEQHSFNRDKLFEDAKEILDRLSKFSIGDFRDDRYPIVALSRGHVNYLMFKNELAEAMLVATSYFNKIQKFSDYGSNEYLKDTAQDLMLFSVNGSWKTSNILD